MTTLSKLTKKRIMGDLKICLKSKHKLVDARPEDQTKICLNWYFLLVGPRNSVYEGGYYFGQILHDSAYPFKPPDYKMLTPSGRFLIDKKICNSNSSYHSSEWSLSWNIMNIVVAFLSIFMDDNEHGISHIKRSEKERRRLAKQSIEYNKKYLAHMVKKFPHFFDENGDPIKDGPVRDWQQKQIKKVQQESVKNKKEITQEYSCPYCKKIYKKDYTLKRHIKFHCKKKPEDITNKNDDD